MSFRFLFETIFVEDCAAAMEFMFDGKNVGTFGDYAIVSFNSIKFLNVPFKRNSL